MLRTSPSCAVAGAVGEKSGQSIGKKVFPGALPPLSASRFGVFARIFAALIAGKTRFKPDKTGFGPDKMEFKSDKTGFDSGKTRFRSGKMEFGPDKTRLKPDKTRGGPDKTRLRPGKTEFAADKARSRADKTGFTTDKMGFAPVAVADERDDEHPRARGATWPSSRDGPDAGIMRGSVKCPELARRK